MIMPRINQVVVAGNITQNVEVRYTKSGKDIGVFSIAVNENRKQGDEWVEETSFIKVEKWNVEKIADRLKRGTPVLVTGKLKQKRWETDNGKRSEIVINAFNIQILEKKKTNYDPVQNNEPSGTEDDVPF